METLDITCKWASSPVFPGEYLVSDSGSVFSLRTSKRIRPNTDHSGYLYYVLCVNGNRRTVKAHRLVAQAFIPNPFNKPTVNHRNGDRKDNRVENLEWATYKEQTNDLRTAENLSRVHKMTDYRSMGALRNFGRKAVAVIRDDKVEYYPSLKEAAAALGENYSKLSERINGKRPQRKSYTAVWASEIEEFPIAVTKLHFGGDNDNSDGRR